jgi:hypothetical protein
MDKTTESLGCQLVNEHQSLLAVDSILAGIESKAAKVQATIAKLLLK